MVAANATGVTFEEPSNVGHGCATDCTAADRLEVIPRCKLEVLARPEVKPVISRPALLAALGSLSN